MYIINNTGSPSASLKLAGSNFSPDIINKELIQANSSADATMRIPTGAIREVKNARIGGGPIRFVM